MVRRMVLVAAIAAATAVAQNATLNVVADDSATVYLNGSLVTMPARGGAVPVTIAQGQNTLAIAVRDISYGAGLAASIDLTTCGTADTVITDSTWKVSMASPTGWETAAFDASAWHSAGSYGPIAKNATDFTRVNLDSVAYAKTIFNHGGQWLWTPPKVYFRKVFDRAAAVTNASAGIIGHGFAYKIYVNGALVGSQDTAQVSSQSVDIYPGVALAAGLNVIAVEATCLDSIQMAYFKAGLFQGPTRFVLPDTTWRCSFDTTAGWAALAYADTATWSFVKNKEGLGIGGPFGSAKYIWPCQLYFRTTFNAPVAGVSKPVAGVLSNGSVVAREYYTLQGQRITEAAARNAAGAMVIERATLNNGSAATQLRQSR